MNKLIPSLFLLTLSFSTFAAEEIRNFEVASMKQHVGSISVELKDGTLDEAVSALSKKTDQQGADYYHITSIGVEGMGGTVRATAEIYK